jgi:asparagine synthase (glutamine-hydrolysing)
MCGICGVVGKADEQLIKNMLARIAHRGPDDEGVYIAETSTQDRVGLGHRRLSIIDLSPAGHEPMPDASGRIWLTYNGEIYNFKELRHQLESLGHRFNSNTDGEVILYAYLEWGRDCLTRFNGMFAFAIWDSQDETLFMARDRLGIKPLYYAHTPAGFAFASEIKALIAIPGLDRSPDLAGLDQFMTFLWTPDPRTAFRGISKLPPAHYLIYRNGRVELSEYWDLRFEEDESVSEAEWTERVREQIARSVRSQLLSDVPLGAFLSGGIDSSTIVPLMSGLSEIKPTTYTLGFRSEDLRYDILEDDVKYARMVGEQFKTDYHETLLEPQVMELLPKLVYHMDEPVADPAIITSYLICRSARERLTVLLSGMGGDEVFAGYSWYPPLAEVPRARAMPAYARVFTDRPHDDLANILEPEWLLPADPSRAFVAEHFARAGATESLDAALRIDSTIMLVDDPVKRVDNMTMAWGLEARVPFLDHELVELAAACPPALKLAHGGKGVLKEAARGVVPDAVIDRPKGYFPVPAIRHLEGPFLERVRDAVDAPVAKARGLVRRDWLDAMLADPNTQRTNLGSNALWQVALLEMWLQERGI